MRLLRFFGILALSSPLGVTMRRSRAVLLAGLGVTLGSGIRLGQQARRVDDAVLKNASKTGEEWLTYGLSLAETRFSPLTQINTTNVKRLGLAWSYDLGSGGGGQEGTPLVWNDTIYGITN